MKHLSNVKENQYNGKTVYKFTLTLGINTYHYVAFWGTLAELKALDACTDILGTYKFYGKIANVKGKTYYNLQIHLPKDNTKVDDTTKDVKW